MRFARSDEALIEVTDLYQRFQVGLPYFVTPTIAADTRVRLLPAATTDLPSLQLRFNPRTATWCLLEEGEAAAISRMDQPVGFSDLARRSGLPTLRLRRLLVSLYRLGLVEIGGDSGLDQEIFAEGPLFGKRYNIELLTTDRCNLACAYCFARAGTTGRQMDPDTGFDVIDRALALETSAVWLKFDGGEVLLDFEHFRRLVTYARDRGRGMGKRLGIGIQLTTNGTLLDEAMADFLAEQEVRVHLSLDGPEPLHDEARPAAGGASSYGRAVRGLRLVQERGIDCMVIGAVGPHNCGRALEVAQHLADLGVESVRFNPVYRAGRGEKAGAAITAEQYGEFLSEVLGFIVRTGALREENLAAMARNLIVRTRDYRCMRSPCGAGYDHFAIDPAGDVYPCGAFRLAVPESRLGNVAGPLSLAQAFVENQLVRQMGSRIVANIPECAECTWRHLCEGGCSLDAYRNAGGLMRPPTLCAFYQRMYPELLAAMAREPALLNFLVPEGLWCHL